MLLGKQSEVKKRLSTLRHTKNHLTLAANLSEATDASLTGPGAISVSASAFAKDYYAEHTIPDQSVTLATADSPGASGAMPPETFKSVQA